MSDPFSISGHATLFSKTIVIFLLSLLCLFPTSASCKLRKKTPFECQKIADQISHGHYHCLYLLENRKQGVSFLVRSRFTAKYYSLKIRKNTADNRRDMYFFFLMKQNPYLLNVHSYKIDSKSGLLYSLDEFCRGGNLQQYLRHYTKITESDILLIFYDILKSVKAIHDSGYVHGDLKLENILMCTGDSAKLKSFRSRVLLSTQASKRGTPLYMPPEALMDLFRPRDFFFRQSFDNYSLGVLLYFMLHYKFPFYGDSYESLMLAISNREVEIDPSLSPLSKTLLAALLSFDSTKRESTSAILTMLRHNIPTMAFSDYKQGFGSTVFTYHENNTLRPIKLMSEKYEYSNGPVLEASMNDADREYWENLEMYQTLPEDSILRSHPPLLGLGLENAILNTIAAADRMENIATNMSENVKRDNRIFIEAERKNLKSKEMEIN